MRQPVQTQQSSGCLRRGCGCLFGLLLLPLLLGAGFIFWWSHRPQPPNRDRELFPGTGITYVREVQREGQHQVIHVVSVPLNSPDISFLVTPPDDKKAKRPLKARKTSAFLKEFKVQIAINGDNFYPFYESTFMHYQPSIEDLQDPGKLPSKLWSSYPSEGDPVETEGLSASRGVLYCDAKEKRESFPTLFITKDNKVSFLRPLGEIYNAISGSTLLLDKGVRLEPDFKKPVFTERHPRTAIGIDRDKKWLILMVVDGRQPNYSEGMTLMEMTDTLEHYGAYTAMLLDGGGSSALVVEEGGQPQILNTPIEKRIPGRERPVANHLGIFVKGVGAEAKKGAGATP